MKLIDILKENSGGKYKWLAVDCDGELNVFVDMPCRAYPRWADADRSGRKRCGVVGDKGSDFYYTTGPYQGIVKLDDFKCWRTSLTCLDDETYKKIVAEELYKGIDVDQIDVDQIDKVNPIHEQEYQVPTFEEWRAKR